MLTFLVREKLKGVSEDGGDGEAKKQPGRYMSVRRVLKVQKSSATVYPL
jgi:hypothetical protein